MAFHILTIYLVVMMSCAWCISVSFVTCHIISSKTREHAQTQRLFIVFYGILLYFMSLLFKKNLICTKKFQLASYGITELFLQVHAGETERILSRVTKSKPRATHSKPLAKKNGQHGCRIFAKQCQKEVFLIKMIFALSDQEYQLQL